MLNTTNSSQLSLYSATQKESESAERQAQFTLSTNCCSPEFRPYRYLICVLVFIIDAMSVYSLEFPVGIEPVFIRVMELDHSQYNLIFSAYSWCDIVMSFLGSIFVSKCLGIRLGLVVFTIISTIGQLMVSFGAYVDSFYVVLFGRIVIGCGVGTRISIASSYFVKWFHGKEITFIMAMNRCFCRLAATMALFSPMLIYNLFDFLSQSHVRLGTTFMMSSFLCICGVGLSIVVAFLDKYGSGKINERYESKKDFNLSAIIHLPLNFWIIIILIGIYYSIAYVSTANAPLFFINKYQYSIMSANLANSLSYTSVILMTPFIGLCIDYTGYNLLWGLVGITLSVMLNLLYIITDDVHTFVPFVTAILFSLSYSFFGTAMLVCVSFFVETHHVTMAYGLALSFEAFSTAIVGVLSGIILDTFGYLFLYLFHLILLFIISYLMIYVSVIEVVLGNRILNVTGKSRR